MLERTDSEYSLSLHYLLKSYTAFVDSLTAYLSMPLTAEGKLKGLISVWTHPKGIQSLVRTLTLQFDQTISPEYPLASPGEPLSAAPPDSAHPFELPNVLSGQSEVKLQEEMQESEEGSDESERDEASGEMKEESSMKEQGDLKSSVEECSQRYKRGPYKSYSMAEKEHAVKLLLEDEMPLTEISRKLRIPCKNIKRWSTEGVFRKRGGGRKRSTPHLEHAVLQWIRQSFHPGQEVDVEQLQAYALALTDDPLFKASRGWVIKFLDRYKLRDVYQFR